MSVFPLESNMFYKGVSPTYNPMVAQQRATDGSIVAVELQPKTIWMCDDIKIRITTNAEYQSFLSFFNSSRATPFQIYDPTFSNVYLEAVGIGNGSTTVFELDNQYVTSGTVSVYLNNVLQNSGYSVNYTTGTITFTSAVTNGVAITCSYRFRRNVLFTGSWSWEKRAIPDGQTITNVQLGIITFSVIEATSK